MDGRLPPLLLIPALLAGLTGCVPSKTTTGLTASKPNPPVEIVESFDRGNRAPKATTIVSMGNLHQQDAVDPKRSPMDQEASYEKARQTYQQALQLDPKCMPALVNLARLYNKRGDQVRAVATYRKALELAPKDPGLWHELGICQARYKDWDGAITSLQKAVEMDPENRQVVNALGFGLARAGRYDEAFATFKNNEGEARAHYNLARMLNHLNRPEDCKKHLRLALQANPELADAEQLLLAVNYPTGDVGNAIPVNVMLPPEIGKQ